MQKLLRLFRKLGAGSIIVILLALASLLFFFRDPYRDGRTVKEGKKAAQTLADTQLTGKEFLERLQAGAIVSITRYAPCPVVTGVILRDGAQITFEAHPSSAGDYVYKAQALGVPIYKDQIEPEGCSDQFEKMPYSEVLLGISGGSVKDIYIGPPRFAYEYTPTLVGAIRTPDGGTRFFITSAPDTTYADFLRRRVAEDPTGIYVDSTRVNLWREPKSRSALLSAVLISFPLLSPFLVWWLVSRRKRKDAEKEKLRKKTMFRPSRPALDANSDEAEAPEAGVIVERSRIRRLSDWLKEKVKPKKAEPPPERLIRFEDVAGCHEAKAELWEVVEFLAEPERYVSKGARMPKGALLVGPPGCGKTLLAKAVRGEASALRMKYGGGKVHFIACEGSQFVEMYVGRGASRIRDLFKEARENQPAIIFIDEFDGLAKKRSDSGDGGDSEYAQTLNQLLVEMDGSDSDDDAIMVIAATNRPDILDPAAIRPGRFDRHAYIDAPDSKAREEILKVHARGKPVSKDVDFKAFTKMTQGCDGAGLANVMNEAALLIVREKREEITAQDIAWACNKVMYGTERKSLLITPEERRVTAYHEAGHAIVMHFLRGEKDSVDKITIIPRGRGLGATIFAGEDDRRIYSEEYLRNRIAGTMGGRAAEAIIYNRRTSGASQDIEQATQIAHRMVCELGMSPMGPIALHANGELMSERTRFDIDNEKRSAIKREEKRARQILEEHIDLLHRVAAALLSQETLERDEFEAFAREHIENRSV
jgi:cell division protease FtsH